MKGRTYWLWLVFSLKSLPLGYKMFYIPRGPILDYRDTELLKFVLQSIKSYARSKRAIL